MKPDQKFFYGFYLTDENLSGLIDLLTFVFEPEFLRKTHITVRGPYKKDMQYDIFKKNNRIKSEINLLIDEPSAFFSHNQNTVFLTCEVDYYDEFIYKPHFPRSKAHITVYDGTNREVASDILELIGCFPWNIVTHCTDLRLIQKKKKSYEYFLIDFIYSELLENLFIPAQNASTIRSLNWADRKIIAKNILNAISKLYPPSN